jgi:hypothetical protein
VIRRILRALGLVSAGAHAAVVERLRKAEGRALKLAQQLGEARSEARGWKTKANETHQELRGAQAKSSEALRKAREEIVEARQAAKRAEARQAEAERRAQRAVDLETAQKTLADSEHALTLAREQLMAIEVKLDILEGAANVLDSRTRALSSRRTMPDGGVGV